MRAGRHVRQAKTNALLGGDLYQSDLGPDLCVLANSSLENDSTSSANVASITSTLAMRLSKGITYTSIGSRVCVVVNPGRNMENRAGVIKRRVQTFSGGANRELDFSVEDGNFASTGLQADDSSHVLQLVENAYIHAVQGNSDQSILLLGESGSGKSSTFEFVQQHLIALAPPSNKRTVQRIQTAHRLLKFLSIGLYASSVEYQFSARGSLVGAKYVAIAASGLVQDSVPQLCQWMLASLTAEQLQKLNIPETTKFTQLQHASTLFNRIAHRNANSVTSADKSAFLALLKDLSEFGFKQKHTDGILTLLSVLLHLGNLTFIELDSAQSDAPCDIKDPEISLACLARLLDVSPVKLQEILVNRFVSGDSLDGGDSFSVILTASEAADRRDALVRALYDRLVCWIVFRVNKKLCMEEVVGYANHIQVIDFPGASHTSSTGGLRDLLIEYANAKLQNVALDHMCNENLFKAEGIGRHVKSDNWLETELKEQYDLLQLLGRHTHEMTERGQGTRDLDELFLSDAADKQLCTRIRSERKPLLFTSKHKRHDTSSTPQITQYSADGFVASNESGQQVLSDLIRLLNISFPSANQSMDPVLSEMLNCHELNAQTASSTSATLTATVIDLADSLQDTQMWVIAHVRVSDDPLNPLRLDALAVARQVNQLQLERMARSFGPQFTCSLSHHDFADRYASCAAPASSYEEEETSTNSQMFAKTATSAVAACSTVALAFGYSDTDLAIGAQRVFLSESAWRELEAHLGLIDMKRHEAAAKEGLPALDMNPESVNGEGVGDSSTQGGALSSRASPRGEPLVQVTVQTPEKGKQQRGNPGEDVTKLRKRWLCLTWLLTWWIPSLFLRVCGKMKRKDVQIAWREKVALCIISAGCCAVILFLIIGLGRILCPLQKVLSQGEIDGMTDLSNPIVSLYGAYYLISDIIKDHVSNNGYVGTSALADTVLGHDVSAMFYKTTVWANYCKLPQPPGFDNVLRNIPPKAMKVWYPHEGNDAATNKPIDYVAAVAYMRKGMVARNPEWIQEFFAADPVNNKLLVAYDNVYDVSAYASSGNVNTFLGSNIGKIIDQLGGSGIDATAYLEQVRNLEGHQKWLDYMGCLNGLFLTGVIDHRQDKKCLISNYIMLAASSILVVIIGMKFFTALQCPSRRRPENHDRYVLIQVPCYTESQESLLRTFESVLLSHYQDSRKLLFVIADGMIVGSGNDRPTPKIVLDVLGWRGNEPEAVLFQSLGDGMKQANMAKIYSGYYAINSKAMKFIVVVKVGLPNESNRPGNRGKRDSQLLIMKFLNRVHFDTEMNPMEIELVRSFHSLQLDPRWFEYLLWIDADTEIYPDSVNRLVACLISDSKVVGICGETQVGNERESWVTMIQVYEYYISHHLSKQFESVFGAVTCLPGCFSMFRIRASNRTAFLISNDVIRDFSINKVDTLHLKNLLHLGEDRYLTTLMMKHFPSHKLSFSPDAKCKTQAPSRWKVFLSQRRRWINSTVHTLFELMMLPQLCGCCMFSMRVVVFIDLFSTLAQPSAVVYFAYLIYSALSDESHGVPLFSLIMIGAIYGVQLVIFMLKGEFQHLGWMVLYLLAIPIYSFYLPIYAFWHFDDFSWGNTRVVVDESGGRVHENAEETFDPSIIPMQKWSAGEQDPVGRNESRIKVFY